MDLTTTIDQNMLVCIPILNMFGYIMKKIPWYPDWLIPFTLIVIGVGYGFILEGNIAKAAINGVLCAGAAIGLYSTGQQIGQVITPSSTQS